MDLITAEELAIKLKLNLQTVYKLAREGKIPSVRIGGAVRFDEEEVVNFLRGGDNEGGSGETNE